MLKELKIAVCEANMELFKRNIVIIHGEMFRG